MAYCPRCKENFAGDLTACPRCGYEFGEENGSTGDREWILIARIRDKTSADYARETLDSYQIPSVVFSRSGYFGQVGLNLPSLYGKNTGKFEIHVPADCREEAEGVLGMILGDSWERVDDSNSEKDI
jgi:hypothetical protein